MRTPPTRRLLFLSFAAAIGLLSPVASAEDVWVDDSGVALGGYDLVAYYIDGSAVAGSATHSATHDGVTYYFASAAHRAIFEAAPQEFLPEYEGYCAFAVAMHSRRVPPNPETFKVQDGRLFLFFNGPHEGQVVNTLPMWEQDTAGNLATADANWNTIAE